MVNKMTKRRIRGINVCNPVKVEKDYLLYAVKYAQKYGMNHIQINGPIHDGVRGNIDGMTQYRKYACFNSEKDLDYVATCMDAVNTACEEAEKHGVSIYLWHHELELPYGFTETYPETVNESGDVEVTHPKVKDFLEHKLGDFFEAYPKMAGLILTLHETKVPLLKLKNQKLGEIERVKYVTQILHDTCKRYGKELIVRPFASIEEDYVMMEKAYEEVSLTMPMMDKWTQFDWSLTLPNNHFFQKIERNPLVVEGDIFGEFFGKGYLPVMLKKHLKDKVSYCDSFSPLGYVVRIDRGGRNFFGDINEVNMAIFNACNQKRDVEQTVSEFFAERYPQAAKEVQALMEKTEDVQTKMFYANGFYFTESSHFPSLNHSKNHYYFELFSDECGIDSNEWFVPRAWTRGPVTDLITEKKQAMEDATKMFAELESLKGKMEDAEYQTLWKKFYNLKLTAEIWYQLAQTFRNYVLCFQGADSTAEDKLQQCLETLLRKQKEGYELLGDDFYGMSSSFLGAEVKTDRITQFVKEVRQCYLAEKMQWQALRRETNWIDAIVCGSATEGHFLQKEVNFSDTLLTEDGICRISGNSKGAEWATIKAHGWFSYQLAVTPNAVNKIVIEAGAMEGGLDMKVTVGESEYQIHADSAAKKEHLITYTETKGESKVRIRFDKTSTSTPCVYTVKCCK